MEPVKQSPWPGVLRNRWVRWSIGVVVVLAIPVYLFGYHVGGHRVCGGCKSFQDFDRFGFGNPEGGRIEVVDRSSVRESVCFKSLFDGTHRHRWRAGQFHVDSRRWGITCAGGNMRHNRFGGLYELDGEFRGLVDGRIRRGEISPELARTLVEFPRYGSGMFLEEVGREPPPADIASAMETGRELVHEFVKSHPACSSDASFP